MHDVFIVISEGRDGEHVARTFYAADLDDARRTHHDNYADEPAPLGGGGPRIACGVIQ